MARLPDPTTALGRRPVADLRRPVASFNPDFSGSQNLAAGVNAVAAEFDKQAEKSARMDALKKLTEFQRQQTEAYAEHYAKINENPGAHIDSFMTTYDAQAKEVLGSVDRRAQEWFEQNLVQTRQQLWQQAFGDQRKTFAATEISDYQDAVSSAAAMNTRNPVLYAQAKQIIIEAGRQFIYTDPVKAQELRRNAMFTLDKSMLIRMVDSGDAGKVLGWMQGNDPRWQSFPLEDRAEVKKYAEAQYIDDLTVAADEALDAGDLATATDRINAARAAGASPVAIRRLTSARSDAAARGFNSIRNSPVAATPQQVVLSDIASNAQAYPDVPADFFAVVGMIETSLGASENSKGRYTPFELGPTELREVGGDPSAPTTRNGMEFVARKYRAAQKIAESRGVTFEPWMAYVAHQQGEGGLAAFLSTPPTGKAADALVEKTKDEKYQGAGGRDAAVAQILKNTNKALNDPTVGDLLTFMKNKYEARRSAVPAIGAPPSPDVTPAARVPESAFIAVPDTFEAWDREQLQGPRATTYGYMDLKDKQAAYVKARKQYAADKEVQDRNDRLIDAAVAGRPALKEDVNEQYKALVANPDLTPEEKAGLTQALIANTRRLPTDVADQYSSRLMGSTQDAAAAVQELAQYRAKDVVFGTGEGGLSKDAMIAFERMDRELARGGSVEDAVAKRDKLAEMDRNESVGNDRRSTFNKRNNDGYVNHAPYVEALKDSGLSEAQAAASFQMLRDSVEDDFVMYGDQDFAKRRLVEATQRMHIAPSTYGNRAQYAGQGEPGEPMAVRHEIASVIRDRMAKSKYKFSAEQSDAMLEDYIVSSLVPSLPGGGELYAAYRDAVAARDAATSIDRFALISDDVDQRYQALIDHANKFNYIAVDDPETRGRKIWRVSRPGEMQGLMVVVGAELGGTAILYADPNLKEAPNFSRELEANNQKLADQSLEVLEQQHRQQRESLGAQPVLGATEGYSLVALGNGELATTPNGTPLMMNDEGDIRVIPRVPTPITVVAGDEDRVVWVNIPDLTAPGALRAEDATRMLRAPGSQMINPLTNRPFERYDSEEQARAAIAQDEGSIEPSMRGVIEATKQVLDPYNEDLRNAAPEPPRTRPDYLNPLGPRNMGGR